MPAPEDVQWDTIWIGTEDTAADEGYFPIEKDGKFNELSIFEKKVTFGAIDKDSDDIISSQIYGDLSGGGQIDLMSGADQTRYRHGVIDAASPFTITLPRYWESTKPTGASGTSYPANQIGDSVYGIFGTKVYEWDEDNNSWDHTNAVTLTHAPIGKGTVFNGKVYFPLGADGYMRINGPGIPSVNTYSGLSAAAISTDSSSPTVVDFEVWDNKIWALTTIGALAYSFTGNNNEWKWDQSWNAAEGRFMQFDSSTPPRRLITYFDHSGEINLYAITDRAVYLYNSVDFIWEPTTLQFAPHPDFGRAAAVWRPGEDLHIGVGLSKITYTSAGVIDPESGLNRNDGMPFTNLGVITDLEPETSMLFATVSGKDTSVSSVDYSSKFGTTGSGNTNFNTPNQIAIDSSGNIYIADTGNSRIKKHDSSGTFVATTFTLLVGMSPTGVTVDSSGNVYAVEPSFITKHTSSGGSASWNTVATGNTSGTPHITTDGTHIYFTLTSGVEKRLCSTGAFISAWGTSGTGDGQFNTPVGIATDGTYIYVVDRGNDRIQKFTLSGTFVTKWGSSGTNDGQFLNPISIAIHPTTGNIFVGDGGANARVQEFSSNGVHLRTYGSVGSADGQFTAPAGIVFNAAGDKMYVSDSSLNKIQIFDITNVTSSFHAIPTLMYWTGVGWHGAWELTGQPAATLTWANVTATSHTEDGYRLWWGCSDGNMYTMPLRRTFHNPRAGFLAGYDKFAENGYLITSRFDALMAGFNKKASRMVVYMDNATPSERVKVQYRVDDPDAAWSDFLDENGDTVYVTSKGATNLPFNVDSSGFSWGQKFNWIQFRFEFERGPDNLQTPVLSAAVLNYTKIPQQAKTFMFTVVFPKRNWRGFSGQNIQDRLADLLNADSFVKLVHQNRTYRGQLAAVAGVTATGQNTTGGAQLNFIEIRV